METAMQSFQRQMNHSPAVKTEVQEKPDNFTVIYCLTNVDIIGRTATLQAMRDGGAVTKLQVSISRLIAKCISDQRTVGTKIQYEENAHESKRFDPLYRNNPFKLTMFKNADGSFKNWHVEHVKELGVSRKQFYDTLGRKQFLTGYKYSKSVNYTRYQEVTCK